MRTVATLIALLFTGCLSATMLRKPDAPRDQFAPSNEDTSIGEVRYLNAGAAEPIRTRREDAYRQMHAACAGAYSIVDERDVVDVSPWRHVRFRCGKASSPGPVE